MFKCPNTFDQNPGQKSLGHHNFFICLYYWIEIDSIWCKITLWTPIFPPPLNVEVGVTHRQLFYSIFNIERAGGGERVLSIKLTSVNVQVPQHFWPGLKKYRGLGDLST